MYGIEESDLKRSVQKAGKICQVIQRLFLVALVLYSVSQIVLIGAVVVGEGSGALSDAASVLVYIALHCVIVVLFLVTMVRIFAEASQGKAPFSEKQADRLRLIALLAFLLFLLEAAFTAVVSYNLIPEVGYSIGINDAYPTDSINLNVGMLAFSAIMYSLSALFRYAALSQQLSDDTV